MKPFLLFALLPLALMAGAAAPDATVADGSASPEPSYEALFASTNASVSVRIDAAKHLAERARKAGNAAGARALLETCLAFPGNLPANYETIVKAIGETYVLEDNADAAVEAFKRCLAYNSSPDMQRRVDALVVGVYRKFFRYADARDYCLERGDRVEAARICEDHLDEGEKALGLFREVLADASAPRPQRFAAWERLLTDAVLAERYLPFALGDTPANTNAVVKALERRIWEAKKDSSAYRGNYADVIRLHGLLERVLAAAGRVCSFQTAQYVAMAHCGLHDFAAAAAICRDALEKGVTSDSANLYQLNVMAALLPLTGDRASLLAAIRAADAKFAGDLPMKTRVSRLDRVGAAAVIGANEPLARALADFRKTLFVPYPKRDYVVHYSDRPITGPEGWESLKPVPEVQAMDRQYAGSAKILLETDVATGSRGEGVGSEKPKEGALVPTIQIACDAVGLHFRFEVPDDRAPDVAAGLCGAGSFEAYVAAGENQPYYCLLMDIAPKATVSVWNTTFSTAGHRRIGSDDQSLCKSETAFTDHSTISYIRLSWNAFSTLIPENGSVWEFENLHWGRADQAAWNGVESAHGRSQWGRLVFDLPPRARIEILKGVVFDARRIYMGAKAAYSMGPVDRWRDPVLGDGDFYDQCVAPLLERLDAYLPLVTADMADEDVLKVAEEAVPGWRDIRHEVARLRAQYLRRKFSK